MQRGRLWAVIPYTTKHARRDTGECSEGRKTGHSGIIYSFLEAKSSIEPGVFKEIPKINQPVFKALCHSFPYHGGRLPSTLSG